jgi:hypothetical protein
MKQLRFNLGIRKERAYLKNTLLALKLLYSTHPGEAQLYDRD